MTSFALSRYVLIQAPNRSAKWVRAAAMAVLLMFVCLNAQAQTFTVLHNFTGGGDGSDPVAGISIDRAGNLYGASEQEVYKLTNKNGSWIFSPLFNFSELSEGSNPYARPVAAPDGTLYGSTQNGGSQTCEILGCGLIYRLRPTSTICRSVDCYWSETLPWVFLLEPGQGVSPTYGDLLFDPAGDILGTTASDGGSTTGTVYKLTNSGGSWGYSTLYNFAGGDDGKYPLSGVVADSAGNLYGTTSEGGSGNAGTVYELSPSGSGWTETVLYSFQNAADGGYPVAGLLLDQSGNLYGAATTGGANGGGTIFKLTPVGDGNWTFSVLYSFVESANGFCPYASGPTGTLVMDTSGNLYGNTCTNGAFGFGAIFKLTPSHGGWTYASMHDFEWASDGAWPFGNITLTSNGTLYGTATGGGTDQRGTVWEIDP
jgi:uncharacterized repeat protein (TIGR03803 family)